MVIPTGIKGICSLSLGARVGDAMLRTQLTWAAGFILSWCLIACSSRSGCATLSRRFLRFSHDIEKPTAIDAM